MKFSRVWAMPSKNTFEIKPIAEIVKKYAKGKSIDPFANESRFAAITNDIDPAFNTDFHMDALDFLRMFEDGSVDTVLYDPPFSPRQVSESYRRLGMSVNLQTTQASYWARQKAEIARIVKQGGFVVSCSWNSGGIGQGLGFEIVEILLVPHGGWHNDTICTVETKVSKVHDIALFKKKGVRIWIRKTSCPIFSFAKPCSSK